MGFLNQDKFTAVDKYRYGGANGVATEGDITSFGRSILDDTDANSARSTLGLGSGDNSSFNNVTASQQPTAPGHLTRKDYVDGLINGLKHKDSVVVATTGNITLSGEQTIDGVLTSTSRVLAKDQSTGSQNGFYVSGPGAWTRATDADSESDLVSASVFVSKGTTNGDTQWVCTNDSITVGSTALTFSQHGGASGDSWSDAVDAVITPDANGTRDLGTTGARFATGYLNSLTITNNIDVSGTVDGRDLQTDGTKLDAIEASADVTDEANVKSALDGANIANVVVAGTDKVLIQDADDTDNLKHVTAQSIADLSSGGDEWGDVVDAVITPDANGTRDLATTGTRFATGYFDALDVTNHVTVGGRVEYSITEKNVTGTETLTDSSDTYQLLNPTSGNQDVVLPLLSTVTTGSVFIITHDGSSNELQVKEHGSDGGSNIGSTLATANYITIIKGATEWKSFQ